MNKNRRTHIESFYDRVSFLYPIVDVFLKSGKKRLAKIVNSYPAGQLLEIGSGTGKHLSLYHGHTVTGIDISSEMIKRSQKYQSNKISILKMDAHSLLFEADTFDYAVMSHTVAVVENPHQVLMQIFKVLKPGGKLFMLNHFTPEGWAKYLDIAFSSFSTPLKFKSVFRLDQLRACSPLCIREEIDLDRFSYMRIVILEKPI